MYRLRLGHAGVNKYLNRAGLADSAKYDFCSYQVEETTVHFLYQCPSFYAQRGLMYFNLRKVSIKDVTLKTVLGGDDQHKGIFQKLFAVSIKYLIETN